MSKLPIISGKQCIKVLEKFGYVVYRQKGSHVTLVREDPPSQTTVPVHKELDKGTLRAILRQAGVNVEEFTDKL
jgi:predicted RNA binding protein YcfA (HicA-like mRNA interferase family)